MGTSYTTVTVIEVERSPDADFPLVFGKGRAKRDLVYFQLDGRFVRKSQQLRPGGRITVTADENMGVAEGFF